MSRTLLPIPPRLLFRTVAATATLVLAASACSDDDTGRADTPTPTTDAPAASTTSAGGDDPSDTSTPAGGSIADVDFRNFTLQYPSAASDSGDLDEVTVADGQYSSGEAPDTFYFEVVDVDLADLDGDGAQEAAISIYYNTGGSGQFTDVLVYRWGSSGPEYVTDDGVGDRGDGGVDAVDVAPAGGVVGDVIVVRRNADAEGACCPTALEERTLRLRDDELVAIGDPEKWAIVRVGVDADGNATSEPTVVKFLPGTTRADLTGDATTPVSATFDAAAGQTLELHLDTAALADNPLVVVVSGPDGVGARAGTGFDSSISLTLPSAGEYRLQFDPVEPVAEDVGVYFDADLRIL